jgi:hypothetical protein
MIVKGGKEGGVFLRGKSGKRSAGVHMKKITRFSCTMSMMSVRLLRALTNKTRDAMRALERTSMLETSSIILCEDSASSFKT